MEKYYEILSTCPLFEKVGRNNYDKMLRCFGARVITVNKNRAVFHEGQAATKVGIVLTGTVHTVQDDYFGNRSILSTAGAGQLFAEGFACAGVEALPVSVVATADSQVMLIDCSHIMTMCKNACPFHNQMIRNLLHSVAKSNLQLNQKIEILSKRTTREKVMAYLLSEAKIQGRDDFSIPYDRQELADYLGVERSAMSAVIGKLRDDGIIRVDRRHFQLIR
jgi:CRP-like cAMP-binding protein